MPTRVHQHWLLIQACVWLPVLGWTVVEGSTVLGLDVSWVCIGLAIASYLTLARILGSGRNIADWVTIARFALLICATINCTLAGEITLGWWIILTIAVLADLADGWAARRFGESSQGAVLDMETDQLTTVLLALLAVRLVDGGPWLVLLPAGKHLFVVGLTVRGLPTFDPKPLDGDNARARVICALVMAALLTCTLPTVPSLIRELSGAAALGLLVYSFAADFFFLSRRRNQASESRKP